MPFLQGIFALLHTFNHTVVSAGLKCVLGAETTESCAASQRCVTCSLQQLIPPAHHFLIIAVIISYQCGRNSLWPAAYISETWRHLAQMESSCCDALRYDLIYQLDDIDTRRGIHFCGLGDKQFPGHEGYLPFDPRREARLSLKKKRRRDGPSRVQERKLLYNFLLKAA